jgi:hypothetical protein
MINYQTLCEKISELFETQPYLAISLAVKLSSHLFDLEVDNRTEALELVDPFLDKWFKDCQELIVGKFEETKEALDDEALKQQAEETWTELTNG